MRKDAYGVHDNIAVLLFIYCDAATCIVPVIVAVLACISAVFNSYIMLLIKRIDIKTKSNGRVDRDTDIDKEHKHPHSETHSKGRTHTAGKP